MRILPAERPAGYRLGLVSLLAALVGIAAGTIAYILYDLIGLLPTSPFITNGRFIFEAPANRTLDFGSL